MGRRELWDGFPALTEVAQGTYSGQRIADGNDTTRLAPTRLDPSGGSP